MDHVLEEMLATGCVKSSEGGLRRVHSSISRRMLGLKSAARLIGIVTGFYVRYANPVIIQGHRIFLDPSDSLEILTHGYYEPGETEFIKKVIHAGFLPLSRIETTLLY